MKHKHAEYIKQWLGGAECEWFNDETNIWVKISSLIHFDLHGKVRIKPEPDNVAYSIVYQYEDGCAFVTHAMKHKSESYNLKLIFDGETGKLKDAEVLK